MTATIPLKHGKEALIDLEDYDRACLHKWTAVYIHDRWYVESKINGQKTYLHRFLMNAVKGEEIDHINNDGLDNRRSINLRRASHAANQANQKISKANTSGYKGVGWKTDKCKWRAKIKVNQVSLHLGYFDNKEDAARAYDRAARQYFGAFAHCNFPEE